MIGSICSSPKVLEVMKLVDIVILIIRIVVPIILIVTAMLKYAKVVSSGDEGALQKTNKVVVTNLIAALLVFFIPLFIYLVAKLVFSNPEYRNCIDIPSYSEIRKIYVDEGESLVRKAEQSKNIDDYNAAYNYLLNISDKSKVAEFKERLAKVKEAIDSAESNKIDPGNDNKQYVVTDIIHLGDSRTEDYLNIKSYLGVDNEKETIYAKTSTGYDNNFKAQMSTAERQINSNSGKTYAIVVNYGVNAKGSYKEFCNYYDDFVQRMDKRHEFYIVSVNPFDEKKVRYYQQSNTNANLEIFNNYMKTTCINQIKANSPSAKIYYCDVYGSISLSEWVNNNYITGDGIHYTKEGSKYIYDTTKKCISTIKTR